MHRWRWMEGEAPGIFRSGNMHERRRRAHGGIDVPPAGFITDERGLDSERRCIELDAVWVCKKHLYTSLYKNIICTPCTPAAGGCRSTTRKPPRVDSPCPHVRIHENTDLPILYTNRYQETVNIIIMHPLPKSRSSPRPPYIPTAGQPS